MDYLVTGDSDSPKFRSSPFEGKRVKEKVYIYIYIYKYIINNSLLSFLALQGEGVNDERSGKSDCHCHRHQVLSFKM